MLPLRTSSSVLLLSLLLLLLSVEARRELRLGQSVRRVESREPSQLSDSTVLGSQPVSQSVNRGSMGGRSVGHMGEYNPWKCEGGLCYNY